MRGLGMIANFSNRIAEEIWEASSSKGLPKDLWLRAKALLTIMHSTSTIEDLKIKGQPPNIRLHKLKGDRKDQWSVTVKLPWCITFKFKNGEFSDVKIENYHRG
jgi:toxin HigB-1